ncbi:MAG: hypothetical protein PHR25_06735 [Clostridia bacterium]|nr:hypothetical protein [Clostridia bacterium]
MKQKLFIDFDNTIVNSTKAFCNIYNLRYYNHPNYIKADWQKSYLYNFGDVCPLLKTKEEVENIFCSETFFSALEFVNNNTVDVIDDLSKKYQIIITSIGWPKNIALKSLWIENKLPMIKEFILINNGDCAMDKRIVDMSNGIILDDVESNLISSNADLKVCFGYKHDKNNNWLGEHCVDWEEVREKLL